MIRLMDALGAKPCKLFFFCSDFYFWAFYILGCVFGLSGEKNPNKNWNIMDREVILTKKMIFGLLLDFLICDSICCFIEILIPRNSFSLKVFSS